MAAIAIGLALFVPAFGVALWVLLAIFFGAAFYLGSVARRASSQISLTDQGLTVTQAGPLKALPSVRARHVQWDRLTGIRLRYFSTRRDQSEGWFELTVKDDRASITIFSSLSDFDRILGAAEQTAAVKGLSLSEVTRTNLVRFTKTASAPSGLRAVLRRAA